MSEIIAKVGQPKGSNQFSVQIPLKSLNYNNDSNDTKRTFNITSNFDSFTIWNVDDLPVDKSHPFLRLDEQYRLSELVSVLIFVIDDKGHNESKIRYIKLIKTLNI